MQEETSLRDDIQNAVAEVAEKQPVETVEMPEVVEKPAKERDETGKFKAKEVVETPEVATVKEEGEPAPQALSGAIKAKWNTIEPDVRQEILKRENDMHQAMTRHDGELRLGREMKDVITPYMAQIQSEGGTATTAVKDLLNTAYLLRSGSAQQKAQMVQQIIQTYGVDMGQAGQIQQQDPLIALQQQIANLEQRANPDVIKKQLQEEAENAKINDEVRAFASDPANIHFEKVKGHMAALLKDGQARDMKEAYESAIWSNPEIRSTLMTQQAKPSQDIQAKKAAASSITGSPGTTVPNSGSPDRTLREEIAANLRAAMSS